MITKKISAQSITKIFVVATVLLIFLGALNCYYYYTLGESGVAAAHLKYLLEKVDLDGENTIPAYYEGMSLLVCSLLLMLIAWEKNRARDRFVWQWRILACAFVFLSLDEVASIHEISIEFIRDRFHTSGIFHFAWVIPAGMLVIAMGVMYARFLWNLPARSRWLFVISGVTFVSGALVMEMVGGHIHNTFGQYSIQYLTETIVEEALEMVGITLFIFTLLDYLERNIRHIALEFSAVSREQEIVNNYVEKAVNVGAQAR